MIKIDHQNKKAKINLNKILLCLLNKTKIRLISTAKVWINFTLNCDRLLVRLEKDDASHKHHVRPNLNLYVKYDW